CLKTLESRKKPAENKQTAKAVCYLSRYSYSTVYNYLLEDWRYLLDEDDSYDRDESYNEDVSYDEND
ncbi:MAG: hypothetical protein E6109_17325, partial [Ruminococcus sp.]|nr:hypothetical protein [Ruminococcus sp.]